MSSMDHELELEGFRDRLHSVIRQLQRVEHILHVIDSSVPKRSIASVRPAFRI